jgi:hypothetical protein
MCRILPLLFLFLTSCVNLTFDPVQFERMINIKEQATLVKSKCGQLEVAQTVHMLDEIMNHERVYVSYRKGSPQHYQSIYLISDMISELHVRYESKQLPSADYCNLKLDNIITGLDIILTEEGKL